MRLKKTIIVYIMLVALILSTGMAFADGTGTAASETDANRYTHVNSANTQLSISGSTATCKTTVIKTSSSSANKMVVTNYYYKSSGTYIGSSTTTVYNTNNLFVAKTNKTLNSHGTYYAEALVKLYHNSQLLESFTLVTGNATY